VGARTRAAPTFRLTSVFISTCEERIWDLPAALHIRDGLRRRAVDAHMLATDAQIGDDLDATWRAEINGCDTFLLLWSPEAMHRPHVIAEWNMAIEIAKPRMVVLYPWGYQTRFGHATRFVDYPPGWNSNVKLEKLDGVDFQRVDTIFQHRRVRPRFSRGISDVMDRLATWVKSVPQGSTMG
jgi:hypothetical protein